MMPAPKPPQRGRPTLDQLEARKVRVLEIAEQLFIERGFSDTSVAEITRRANVTPRLVSAHFGDKVQIFIRILRKRTAGASELLTEIESDGSLPDILFSVAKFARQTAYSPTSLSFLRLLVGEGDRLAEATSRIARESSEQFFGILEEVFAQLYRDGLIDVPDEVRLAKYFADLIIGFSLVQAGMNFHDRVSDDDEIRDKIDFFCGSIAARSAAPGRLRNEPRRSRRAAT